jgi:hypothetical protein
LTTDDQQEHVNKMFQWVSMAGVQREMLHIQSAVQPVTHTLRFIRRGEDACSSAQGSHLAPRVQRYRQRASISDGLSPTA